MDQATIVVGVDFKDDTLEFCKAAVGLAQKLGSSITLVHAIERLHYYPHSPYDDDFVNELTSKDLTWQLRDLEEFIELYQVETKQSIIKRGSAYEVLCTVASRLNADAIIVGAGKRFLFESLVGSTVDKVSKLARQKVIIVNNSKSPEVKRIMSAFDFSDNSFTALSSAINLAHFFNAELNIVHIHNTSHDELYLSDYVSKLVDKAISNEQENPNSCIFTPHNTFVRTGSAAMEILKIVDEEDIDLLCIGSGSYKGIRRFFLGQTVTEVIRQAPCIIVVSQKEHKTM